MGLFKKIKKGFHKIESAGTKLFNKGVVGDTKLFGKGSVASNVVSKVSNGLNQASDIAKQVGKEVGKFADMAAPVLAGMGPVGEAVLGASKGISIGLGGLAKTTSLGADLTKQKNYSGSAGEVVANVLEKGKAVQTSGAQVAFH